MKKSSFLIKRGQGSKIAVQYCVKIALWCEGWSDGTRTPSNEQFVVSKKRKGNPVLADNAFVAYDVDKFYFVRQFMFGNFCLTLQVAFVISINEKWSRT